MTNEDLIQHALGVIHPYLNKDRIFGDVGAAVISKSGKLFTGIAIDTPSWGICAERNALAAMATSGEYEFDKIVAVWRDEKTKDVFVLPPCGICREFMRALSSENLNAQVILDDTTMLKVSELIPHHAWPKPLKK